MKKPPVRPATPFELYGFWWILQEAAADGMNAVLDPDEVLNQARVTRDQLATASEFEHLSIGELTTPPVRAMPEKHGKE